MNKKSLKESIKESKIEKGVTYFNVYNMNSKIYIGSWFFQIDCAKELNLTKSAISKCLIGRNKQHKGYIFKYINDPTVNDKEFNSKWLCNIRKQKIVRNPIQNPRKNISITIDSLIYNKLIQIYELNKNKYNLSTIIEQAIKEFVDARF